MSESQPPQPVASVAEALESFVDRLGAAVDPRAFEAVVTGRRPLASLDPDVEPETFTEEHLVRPLVRSARLVFGDQPTDRSSDGLARPDFRLENLDSPVVVETKPVGEVDAASEAIRDDIGPFRRADYGIATDGVVWRLHRAEPRGDTTRFPVVSAVHLGDALRACAVDRGCLDASRLPTDCSPTAGPASRDAVRDALEDVRRAAAGGPDAEAARGRLPSPRHEPTWGATGFALQFARERLDRRIDRVPRERREQRRRDVEAFYDRYVELLFGEGADCSYGTTLLSAVVTPPGEDPPEAERRRFALSLVNRLLFVRLLEERGVDGIEDGVLEECVRAYRETEPEESLYRSEIRPLLETLLDTPPEHRSADREAPDAWRERVPCLGGGLFRPTVPRERKYDVRDGALETVVLELTEGDGGESSPLSTEGRLDPAVVGTVFEKVVNHLGARPDVGLQTEELGAVYTPTDVTDRVTGETVEPAIEARLVETVLEAVDGAAEREAAREYLQECGLGELLDRFADGEAIVVTGDDVSVELPFSDADVAAAAYEAVTGIRILDPACGSGHFLTAAMDRVHRAQVELLTGANGGRAPSRRERYDAKRELALASIYGVDVHEAAVEVARLRVCLKVVEDNGWADGFARLPNVDANIAHGNALVGLPVTGALEGPAVPRDVTEALQERRRAYKFQDGADDGGDAPVDGRDVRRLLDEEVSPELDRTYVSQLSASTLEESIDSPAAFRRVTASIPDGEGVSPSLRRVKARPADGGEFTAAQTAALERAGFDVFYTGTTADLDVGERERALEAQPGVAHEQLLEELSSVLEAGVRFSQVRRQPLPVDLEDATGRPFHWVAEFPELATETDDGYSLAVDVVLGNPPYGDLLSDAEKRLLAPMETGEGYADLARGEVAGNFLERQLDLLADDGVLGNVVTVGVLSSSTRRAEHDLVVERFESATVSSFARRPSQVFDRSGSRVEINPTIITGRPSAGRDGSRPTDSGAATGIESSDFVRFSDETREAAVTGHETSPVDGLFLRDRMGGRRRESGFDVFPKVGDATKRAILETLAAAPRQVGDWLVDESPHRLRHRRSFNYWLVATRGGDDLRNMHEYCFRDRLTQDFAYLAANSSLLYAYHMTYGNMQDFGRGRFVRFPVPPRDALEDWAPLVHAYADALEAGLGAEVASSGTVDYAGATEAKELVDEAEFLLGAVYGLTIDEVRYLQTYDAEFARYGPEGYDAVPENIGEGAAMRVGFGPEQEGTATEPPF